MRGAGGARNLSGAILIAVSAALVLAPPASASHLGCGLLKLSPCPHYTPPPDPGGDENAEVPIPPPGGRLVGFSSNLSASAPYGEWSPAAEYDLAAAAGSNAQRMDVLWSLMEPSPPIGGRHNYSGAGASQGYADRIDARYAAIRARGMTPVITFHSAPGWAQDTSLLRRCYTDCQYYVEPTADRIPAWWDFARFLAERYPDAAFEVWNEPNLRRFYRPAPNPGRYLRLYRSAYGAIKSVRPDAPVLTGGILLVRSARPERGISSAEFLRSLYALGLKSYPDFRLSVHAYPGAQELGAGSWNAAIWAGVVDVMLASSDGGREVWVTETGISTEPAWQRGTSGERGLIATPEQQQDIMRRTYNRLLTMDAVGDPGRRVNVNAVLFYSLVDVAEGGPSDPDYGYGFLRESLEPKPAFCWAVGNEPPGAPERTHPGC